MLKVLNKVQRFDWYAENTKGLISMLKVLNKVQRFDWYAESTKQGSKV